MIFSIKAMMIYGVKIVLTLGTIGEPIKLGYKFFCYLKLFDLPSTVITLSRGVLGTVFLIVV